MSCPIAKYYKQLKKQLELSSKPGFTIDLDDTIYDSNLFWAKHLLTNISNPEHLSADELIAKYRYVKDVPYWQSISSVNEWVESQLTDNHAKVLLPANKDAVKVINDIHEIHPFVGYLTGRSINTITGTKMSLKQNNLPNLKIIAQPEEVILEALGINNGNEWKAALLDYLYPQVLGTIDDNIDLLSFVQPNYKGTICLYSHPEISSESRVVSCPSMADVYNFFSKINS